MTDHPCLEVPFNVVTKWEEIEGSCARFYAAAEWGYKQALATPPPKPPSLKEQALEALNQMDEPLGVVTARRASIIRLALEALPND